MSGQSNSFSKKNYIQGLITGVLVFAVLGGVYAAGKGASKEDSGGRVADRNVPTQPTQPTQPGAPARNTGGTVKPVSDDDYIRGNRDAKVTLIEYSDLECPFCQRFHGTAQQAVDEYGGDVAWVYRHFPLSSHANAQAKAEAAECAGELGGNDAFWAVIDGIFEAGPSMPTSQLAGLATQAGVSQSSYQDCMDSGRHTAKVRQQFTEGSQAGVTGTPGTFVVSADGDQQYVPGALPYASIKSIIDGML